MGGDLRPNYYERPPTVGDIMLQMFSNGRFYILVFLCAALVAVTILASLGDLDPQATTAIISALIGGAIGHVNGALQGTQETIRRFSNGPSLDGHDKE